jgi:UDP-N-acetyl-2-amino-2-deoxyglucuronate dehydrogenase
MRKVGAMRFAIVGCGVIGPLHGRTIAALGSRAELVATVDTKKEAATALAEIYGAQPYTSLPEVLARSDVDTVAVCVPSGEHADIAVQALRAGKNVIVEKPIDVSVESAARLAAAEREAGRTVTVISQHRFDPASRVAHGAVAAGTFGEITSGLASIALWRSQKYYDSGDWRGTWALDGGGALMNQGVHQIDLLVWLLGRPVEVYAATASLAHTGIEVEDTGVATVRFENGALGVIHATTAAYPGIANRVQVHGSRGSAVIDADELAFFHAAVAGSEAPDYGAGRHSDQADAVLPGRGAADSTTGQVDAHVRQYVDFLDAVEQGRSPLVTVAEASRTLAVITSIYRSAQSKRPVEVVLPAEADGPAR